MNQIFDLRGKVAVITGATGVLAGTISKSLAKSGVKLALLTRKVDSLTDLLKSIEEDGGVAKGFQADILSEDSLNKVKNEIIGQFGRIDILLNIAGGNLPGATIPEDKTVFDMSMTDFKKVTDLNLNGTVLPSLIFGKTMSEQKKGVIIN